MTALDPRRIEVSVEDCGYGSAQVIVSGQCLGDFEDFGLLTEAERFDVAVGVAAVLSRLVVRACSEPCEPWVQRWPAKVDIWVEHVTDPSEVMRDNSTSSSVTFTVPKSDLNRLKADVRTWLGVLCADAAHIREYREQARASGAAALSVVRGVS